jgi:retron-type reverse transcriptase
VVAILTPIYEAEFLGFSYGFRPKRSQHQARRQRRQHLPQRGNLGGAVDHYPVR